MSAHSLAQQVVAAGAPARPTALLVRELPVFEVDFAGLEFADETTLPACDRAVLGLGRALGEIAPAHIDAYLGLGEEVSEALVHRLAAQQLLLAAEDAPGRVPMRGAAEPAGVLARILRLLGRNVEAAGAVGSGHTAARPLRRSRASASPLYRLTALGVQALEQGKLVHLRVRRACLQFAAEPLLYLGTVDERDHKYSVHRRGSSLAPERVPPPLQTIDEVLATAPDERARYCGVPESLPRMSGRLVGVKPGRVWEVREAVGPRRRARAGDDASEASAASQLHAQLVCAGFPSSDTGGIVWQAYLRLHGAFAPLATAPVDRLVDGEFRSLPELRKLPVGLLLGRLLDDGALEAFAGAGALEGLLGSSDTPEDAYTDAHAADGWSVHLRVRAYPTDPQAVRAAFLHFVRRRAHAAQGFDEVCSEVAERLRSYWGSPKLPLPGPGEAAAELWLDPALRAALCRRRLHADLVAPYAGGAL